MKKILEVSAVFVALFLVVLMVEQSFAGILVSIVTKSMCVRFPAWAEAIFVLTSMAAATIIVRKTYKKA